MIKYLINKYKLTDNRTKMVCRNVIGNIIIKGFSIALSLIIIPMTLGYVSEYNYGIWISLSSVIGWLTYFDIGINNGLRNKLTQAINNEDYILAKKYVSTTYAILILIFSLLLIVFVLLYRLIDWYSIFSLNPKDVKSLSLVVLIIAGFICMRSVLSTILIILFSYQKSAMSALVSMLEQLFIVIAIFILTRTTDGNLLNLCIAYCGGPIIILLGTNIFLFNGKFAEIKPSVNSIDWSLKKSLFNIGLRFFIIQIAGLIQFQTVNFIILKFFGPNDVTSYNISFKYFNVLYMIWALILAPIWSAITEAKTTNDLNWIVITTKKYKKIFVLFMFWGCIMLLLSQYAYNLWLGDKISKIPFGLSVVVFLYCTTLMWGSLYVQILNGLGALRVQFFASIISPVLFICLCFCLIKWWELGVISVVIASIVANFNGIFLAPYQLHLIITGKKKGTIWTILD